MRPRLGQNQCALVRWVGGEERFKLIAIAGEAGSVLPSGLVAGGAWGGGGGAGGRQEGRARAGARSRRVAGEQPLELLRQQKVGGRGLRPSEVGRRDR